MSIEGKAFSRSGRKTGGCGLEELSEKSKAAPILLLKERVSVHSIKREKDMWSVKKERFPGVDCMDTTESPWQWFYLADCGRWHRFEVPICLGL